MRYWASSSGAFSGRTPMSSRRAAESISRLGEIATYISWYDGKGKRPTVEAVRVVLPPFAGRNATVMIHQLKLGVRRGLERFGASEDSIDSFVGASCAIRDDQARIAWVDLGGEVRAGHRRHAEELGHLGDSAGHAVEIAYKEQSISAATISLG